MLKSLSSTEKNSALMNGAKKAMRVFELFQPLFQFLLNQFCDSSTKMEHHQWSLILSMIIVSIYVYVADGQGDDWRFFRYLWLNLFTKRMLVRLQQLVHTVVVNLGPHLTTLRETLVRRLVRIFVRRARS